MSPEMHGYRHESIIAAARSGSADRIESCLREHIMRAALGVIEFLEHIERQSESPQTGREHDFGALPSGAM